MGKVLIFIVLLLVLGAAGGAAMLLFVDIPAPTARVEKVLPDERLPR